MARVTLNDFNNFLSEHHVFSEFWRNYHEARIFDVVKARDKSVDKLPDVDPYTSYQRFLSFNPIRWIAAAFPWVYTSEGPSFWLCINEDWCVFVKEAVARKRSKK